MSLKVSKEAERNHNAEDIDYNSRTISKKSILQLLKKDEENKNS